MSLYRNSIWFMKGLQEYTKGGYEAAAKSFRREDVEEVQASGRSFMVTGANSGIGQAAALQLAKRGGAVHLVCRDRERAERARDHIVTETGNQNVFVHLLDMSNPHKVWEFAENFAKENETLNVLVNNAGCMVNQRELTEDGLEKNFATNTLGTYVLTTAMLPLLERSDDPRVVTVSSGGMLVQKLDPDDLQVERGPFDGTMVYAQNKRQQVVMTERWAAQHAGVHFSSMHPGWADTPAVRTAMPDFHRRMSGRLRSEEQGADTVVWLALSAAARACPSGLFFQDRKAVATHLPLAWSRSSDADVQRLMGKLDELATRFKVPA